MRQIFSKKILGRFAFSAMATIALGILLSGCGASVAEKVVVKEQIIIPKKHKHHHRHYHRF